MTVTVSTTYVIYKEIIKSSEDRLSQNITNILSISISRISFSGKYHAQIFSDQLLGKADSIKYIVILDNNRNIVSSSTKKEFANFINHEHLTNLKNTSATDRIKFVTCCNGQKIKEIAMPYYGSFDEGQIGIIIAGISTLETDKEIASSRFTLTVLAIMISILGVILVYLTTRWLSSPIRRLASMFQGILDNAPLFIHIRDLKGNVLASTAENSPITTLFAREQEDRSKKNIKRIVLNQYRYSYLTLNFDLLDSSGNIYGICDIATNITEQEKIQNALMRSETDFQAIFELSPVGIANINAEGKFIRANPSLQNILGYTEEELLSKSIYEVTHPDDYLSSLSTMNNLIYGDQMFCKLEKRYIRKDKEIVWVHILVTVQRDQKGKFLQTISLIENVTERKKIELARDELLVQEKEARIEAQNALKIRDEFMSIASHELKTPLTSLLLQNQFFFRLFNEKRLFDYDENKIRNLIQGSIQQLDRLSKLVNDLLNVSRIQSGKLIPTIEEVNLYQLVENIIQRFKMEIDSTHTTVEISGDKNVVGFWGELQIEQIVINLLSNALKFAPGTSILIKVNQEGNWASLTMQDFGIGISSSNVERIFQRFERAVPIENYGGLGLGLYIVKQFAETHGGKVSVISEEGKGATFRVDLPLKST